jgi:beta-fructofuranosidase
LLVLLVLLVLVLRLWHCTGPFYDPLHQRVHLFFGVYPLPGKGPASDQGGFRFWQHVVSNDSVFWRRLPDAIVPDDSHACDATGAHSGSVTLVHGDPVILYTGSLAPAAGQPVDSQGEQVQCIARPLDRDRDPDLVHWNRTGPLGMRRPQAGEKNFRDDTTAWQTTRSTDGLVEWRVGVGASMNISGQQRGVAAVYRSADNLTTFDPKPVLVLHGVDADLVPLPSMWECPDIFRVNASGAVDLLWALKFSAAPHDYYALGDMVTGFANARASRTARIDHGSSFYASKSFVDGAGRRILWAWVKEERACPRSGYCSLQSLPRVVTTETFVQGATHGGMHSWPVLRFAPLPELAMLRDVAGGVNKTGVQLKAGQLLTLPVKSPHMELVVTVQRDQLARCTANRENPAGTDGSLELIVLRSEDGEEQTIVRLSQYINETAPPMKPATVVVAIDRSLSGPTASNKTMPLLSTPCWLADEAVEPMLKIQIFVDATIVEVFVNGGRVAMTSRVYPSANTSGQIGLRSRGGCAQLLASVEAYTLRTIWL